MQEKIDGFKVLVADDDRTSRYVVGNMLRNFGYEYVEVSNGRDAIEVLLDKDPPRIALLDWIMPEFTGPEICSRLVDKQNEQLIYTILLTGREKEGDLIYALEHGAFDFEQKPIKADELKARLNVARRVIDYEMKLRKILRETEIMNKIMKDREMRVIELKQEVNELSLKYGGGILYKSV